MRRRVLGKPADRQRVKTLLKKNYLGGMQTRLSALTMGFSAQNRNAFIAESLSMSEQSVTHWLTSFRKGGLDAVLERGYDIDHSAIWMWKCKLPDESLPTQNDLRGVFIS